MAARRYAAAIQARMNSSRLPGKVLMPLAGAPLLARLVERVRRARRIAAIVVATTDTPADDPVAALCAEIDVACWRGSETDVLDRMVGAARSVDADALLRLTADNPLVDGELIDAAVAAFEAAGPGVEYLGNADDCGFPYGLFVEIATLRALERGLAVEAADVREHVTLHLRRDAAVRRARLEADAPYAIGRVTVDTREDYDVVRGLFERLYARDPAFSHRALIGEAAQ